MNVYYNTIVYKSLATKIIICIKKLILNYISIIFFSQLILLSYIFQLSVNLGQTLTKCEFNSTFK